jgi:hypothetical protein
LLFFPPHRSFYERDDKLTPCLIEIQFLDNDNEYVPLVVNTSRCFPHSRLITGFVTRLARRVPLVEQELPTLPGHLSSPPGFYWGSCYSIFSFICMFCRSLFVLLYFFFWPLCCLFFFDIRILIVPLVSSTLPKDMLDCAQKISTPFGSNYLTSF